MRRAPAIQLTVPIAGIVVGPDRVVAVTIDGQPWSAPTPTPPTEDDLPTVLSQISTELGVAFRVELTVDGEVTVDDVVLPHGAAPQPSRPTSHSMLFGVVGSGFTPGESVSIAVVVSTCVASDDGVASLRMPPGLLARRPGPLLLLGATSKLVVVSDPADHREESAA